MEIISYVGQGSNNSFNQIHKSTLTLDELLYRQKKLSFQAQQKLDFSELTLNFKYVKLCALLYIVTK